MLTKAKGRMQKAETNGNGNGQHAEPVYCSVCEMRPLTPERWTSYGGSGTCEVCERGAGHAPVSNPKSKIENPKSDDGGGTLLTLDVASIEPDPTQPRKEFDPLELEALAQSLAADGQITPVAVNVVHGDLGKPRYRLIDGERRWRAAQFRSAGPLATLKAIVRDVDPATLLRLQGLANLLREDLNAIEEAEWCRRMTSSVADGGGGLTQQQLAERLGVTQAEISNRIRVLRVPAWARELVISGQMSRKHALCLLPFEGVDPILAQCKARTLETLKENEGELGTALEYKEAIQDAAFRATEAIAGETYKYPHGFIRFAIELTDELRKKLGVVELVDGDARSQRATNVKLAKKLLDEARTKVERAAEKKEATKDRKAAKKQKKLTPAEQKKHDADLNRKFQTRLEGWWYDWLRVMVGEELGDGETRAVEDAFHWLVAWALWQRPGNEYRERETAEELAGVKSSRSDRTSVMRILRDRDGDDAHALLWQYARRMLVDEKDLPRGPTNGQNPVVYDDVVETLARLVELDLAAAWRDDRQSPMRQKFFELHSKDQLLELGKELKVALLESQKKSEMVKILLAQQRPLAMPKELAALASKVQSPKSKVPKGKRR